MEKGEAVKVEAGAKEVQRMTNSRSAFAHRIST